MAEVLQQKHVWDADIWGAVITGWQNSTVSEEHWTKILKTLLEIEEAIPSVLYEACRLLELGINKSSHSIPISQFDLAIGTALKLWDASTRCSEQAREAAGDWLQLAINHPAGSLLSFWLHALSRVRAAAGEEWNGMPQEHQNFLTSVVTGHSYAAAVGRVLIASQTYFLFSTDRGWTLRYVLPLFSFSKDHLTAIQAWHGFLGWGSWTEALLPDLMPRFEETFPKLHTEFGSEQRESFCGFLAGIACRSSINPITDGWLNRFLLAVTEEERSMWASSVYRTLSGMKEAAVESAWSNWIESYWQNRIDGVPVPLERPETGEMLHWCLLFKASFPNAADKMYRSPIPRLEHSFLHHDLSGSDLPQRHPVAVAHFVNYLLRNSLIPAYHFEPVANIITKIRPFVEARNELLEICQQLAELGYPDAAALRRSILEDGRC